jgi:hypothetical protein
MRITTRRNLRRQGYSATVEGVKLRLRGTIKPPEELYASILQHREELVRLVEEGIIVDPLEVFDIAREFFGKGERGAA